LELQRSAGEPCICNRWSKFPTALGAMSFSCKGLLHMAVCIRAVYCKLRDRRHANQMKSQSVRQHDVGLRVNIQLVQLTGAGIDYAGVHARGVQGLCTRMTHHMCVSCCCDHSIVITSCWLEHALEYDFTQASHTVQLYIRMDAPAFACERVRASRLMQCACRAKLKTRSRRFRLSPSSRHGLAHVLRLCVM